MGDGELVRNTATTSGMETLWRTTRSRAGVLKLGAAAGAGLGLLHPAVEAWAAQQALSGTVTLTWYRTGDPSAKRLYKQYTNVRPAVKIAEIPEPGGDYAAQSAWLATRTLANHMPDIYEPGTVSLVLDGVPKKQWVNLDPYLSLPNPYVKGNKRWRDLIAPSLLEQGKYLDGHTYVFAAEAAEWGIFYNKDIFKKVGVSVPTTWAELMAVSRKLTAAGYGAFSLSGAVGLSSFAIVIESMLWAGAFKSRPDEPYFMSLLDFCHAVKSGKLVKTGPRTRAAWQLIKAFSQYWTKGTLTATDFRSFTSGKTAMWYTGSWAGDSLLAAIKKTFELDLFPIPPVTKASSPLAIGDTYSGIGVMASGHPYAIPTTSERNGNVKLAIDFLQFYSQPNIVTPLALGGSMLPAVVGAKHVPPLMRRVVEEIVPKQSLLGPVYFDLSTELNNKEGQLSQGYLSGAISLDTALSQMEQLHHQVADAALASVGLS